MMTDREDLSPDSDRALLELAAKAAGMIPKDFIGNQNYMDGFLSSWNPLTSDADAFRLMVLLGLSVEVDADCRDSTACPSGGSTWRITQFHDRTSDVIATRLAIVLAAAEIGRRM